MILTIAWILCGILVVLLIISSVWITKKEKELELIEGEQDESDT